MRILGLTLLVICLYTEKMSLHPFTIFLLLFLYIHAEITGSHIQQLEKQINYIDDKLGIKWQNDSSSTQKSKKTSI